MSTTHPALRRAGELLLAVVLSALTALVVLAVVTALPFAEPSWLPEAFAGTLVAGGVVLVAWLLLRGRGTDSRVLWGLGVLAPPVFTALHLGTLLHGTPLYLFGLGGDQSNRVPYVGRFADSPALHDVFYADAAPFYPPQWFWVGGRLAALFDVPAWLFYKPYAVMTMAVAGTLAFVTWRWVVDKRVAVLLGLVTAVVGVHTNAYEPYSWILICVLPQVVLACVRLCAGLARPADHGGRNRAPDRAVGDPRGWVTTVTVGAYLGWAALGYTLIAGFAAAVVGVVVLGTAWRVRRHRAAVRALLTRLAVVAAVSAAVALLFWHRYLWAVVSGTPHEKAVANDFAPESGAHWPLPMFEVSATGALSLIGLVWLVVVLWPRVAVVAGRAARGLEARTGAGAAPAGRHASGALGAPTGDDVAAALAALLIAAAGWYVLSGLRALTGHTLLPFRMIPVVSLALALAGVFGALALARWAVETSTPEVRTRTRAVAVVLVVLAGVQAGQSYSAEDVEFAAVARGTAPPREDVLDAVAALTPGRAPSDLVVLTADTTVLAYRPYFSYQAPVQAYATPTGRYSARLDEIRRWAAAPDPGALGAALDSGPFRAPDVFVLARRDDGALVYTARINTMPQETVNRSEDIVFRPGAFDDPARFTVVEVPGFSVIARR